MIIEPQRLFLWLPVSMALGIAIYFSLNEEPAILANIIMAGIALAALFLWRLNHWFWLGAGLMGLAIGFSAAQMRVALIDGPQIEQKLNGVNLTGWLERVETRGGGRTRLVIRPIAIARVKANQLPFRVRLNIRKLPNDIRPGGAIETRAVLLPLPPPVRPGGFDFARALYFQGLGAVGFPIRALRPHKTSSRPPLSVRINGFVSRLRLHLAGRIMSTISGSKGAFVTALLVGDRSKLDKTDQANLRAAGLAHLLAISGLHMALMVGSLFWFVRSILALAPKLALEFPIKKWAAGIALIGGFLYLILSGGSVSTLRAFIMLGVMFGAIMVDRPAITMRNVALAAMVILLFMPESLLSPGFQMSFATVISLVAFNEVRLRANARRAEIKPRNFDPSSPLFWLRKFAFYFFGIALTTLIASTAAAPIAAYHFQQMALFSVLSNLVAIPLTGLLLMPAGLIALFAMPFGLEAMPLALAGLTADIILDVARDIASLEGAQIAVRALPLTSLNLFLLGGLWLCLWQKKWRFAGLGLIALGAIFTQFSVRPDIFIARNGANIALRGTQNLLDIASARSGRFTAIRWLKADGDMASLKQARARKTLHCDRLGCQAIVKTKRLAYVLHPAALREACEGAQKADIIISRITLHGNCRQVGIIIGPTDLARNGAYALTINGNNIKIETVKKARGKRPWVVGSRLAGAK